MPLAAGVVVGPTESLPKLAELRMALASTESKHYPGLPGVLVVAVNASVAPEATPLHPMTDFFGAPVYPEVDVIAGSRLACSRYLVRHRQWMALLIQSMECLTWPSRLLLGPLKLRDH